MRGYVKKVFASVFSVLAAFTLLLCACADPYADYTASGLEPKTAVIYDFFDVGNDYSALEEAEKKYLEGSRLELFTDYADYEAFGIEFGYTKGYFDKNALLVFLTTSCSSDGLKFERILVKDNKLCPVISRNTIHDGDAVTADIIYWVYYAEVPAENNYGAGEVIYEFR